MAITAGTAQSAIQTALYTILAGDATLATLVGTRIYDAVPPATVDDYLVFGEWTEESDDTLEVDNAGIGADCTLTLEAVTDDDRAGAGYKRGQAIMSRVKILLHTRSLSPSGWTGVLCQFEDQVSLRDQDITGRTRRRIISTYRIMVEAQ